MDASLSRLLAALLVALSLVGCTHRATQRLRSRAETLPPDVAKCLPATGPHPPLLHPAEWAPPVPLPGAVNSAGAEDSPYVSPDGNTLYFFFTPDVRVQKPRLPICTGRAFDV